jgi:hypothetical protein
MPRGEGQQGKRRGRYSHEEQLRANDREFDNAVAREFHNLPYAPPAEPRPAVLEPTDDDLEWLERIVTASPLADKDTARALAEHALTQRLALRDLRSGRQLVVDEQKAVASIGYELRKALLDMKLTDKVKEDEDEL